MAIKKVYDLSVDLKRTRIKANVPVLVQGDSTEFRLRLLENGKELTPEQINGVTSVELLSGYDAQTIIRTVGTMQGSEAVFSIEQGELFKTGQVKAMVRLADADDRISTLNFEYQVISDLTANYVPGEQDVSIFQQYISDAQQKIDEMAATDVQQLATQLDEKAPVSYVDSKVNAMASGTPKIVVQSIAELPAIGGAEKLALVLDDGHKYYDNGTNWIDAGAYQSTIPSDFVAKNLVANGNFANGITGWGNRTDYTTLTEEGTAARLTVNVATTNLGYLSTSAPTEAAKKYFVRLKVQTNKNMSISVSAGLSMSADKLIDTVQANTMTEISNIVTWDTGSNASLSFGSKPAVVGDSILFDKIIVLNLTDIFGAGNEPDEQTVNDIIDNYHTGFIDNSLVPFMNSKDLFLLNAQSQDAIKQREQEIFDLFYTEPFKFKYPLNGTLTQRVETEYPIVFSRDSVAYDTSKPFPVNAPVFKDFHLAGKKGLRTARATTNLFPSAKSISFSSAETVNLSAGDYTVSIKGGSGKLTISGGYTGEVAAGGAVTFTLGASADVTFTPSGGTPAYAQLEKQIVPTAWQEGGIPRTGDKPRLLMPETAIEEYGVGLLVRLPNDSNKAYPNNEYWLLYGHYDDNNYFRLIYDASNQVFRFYQVVAGVQYLATAKPIVFKKNDLIGLYVHVVPGEGIVFSVRKGFNTHTLHTKLTTLEGFDNGLKHISLGHRMRLESQVSFFADVTMADFHLDINRRPNAEEYFGEVL